MNTDTEPKNLDYFTVAKSSALLDAAEVIARNNSRCVIVLEEGKVVGVLSEGDVLRSLLNNADIHAPIGKYMNSSPRFLTKHDIKGAFDLVQRHGISLVPIVDQEFRLVDVITLEEILNHAEIV